MEYLEPLLHLGVLYLFYRGCRAVWRSWQLKRKRQTMTGDQYVKVDSTSLYQHALDGIVGGKSRESQQLSVRAELLPSESRDGPITVTIGGEIVGYVRPDHLQGLDPDAANSIDAVIVGGWKRGNDEGDYGVRLLLQASQMTANNL